MIFESYTFTNIHLYALVNRIKLYNVGISSRSILILHNIGLAILCISPCQKKN